MCDGHLLAFLLETFYSSLKQQLVSLECLKSENIEENDRVSIHKKYLAGDLHLAFPIDLLLLWQENSCLGSSF